MILEELFPRISKANNVYSFLEFYAGVFLPKEGPVEWTEALERRVVAEDLNKIANINDLYNFVIENSTENINLKAKFESSLIFLALAQKGLTVR